MSYQLIYESKDDEHDRDHNNYIILVSVALANRSPPQAKLFKKSYLIEAISIMKTMTESYHFYKENCFC